MTDERGIPGSGGWGRRGVLGGMLGLGGAALAAPLVAQVAPPGRKLAALCIGIDRYTALSPLRRAVADAGAIAGRLTGIGYDTVLATDCGIDAMLDAFLEFEAKLDGEAAAFMFLAGHGIQVAGRNYYLPADVAALDDMEALERAIPIDNWLGTIAASRPAQTIVILDACRNAGLGSSIPAQSSGLASTNAPGGQFVAFSAAAGEYALDRTGEEDCSANGLFTRHFIEELKPSALIYDVITNTRAKVIPEAREAGHSQHPAVYDQSSRPYRVDGAASTQAVRKVVSPGDLEGTGFVIAAATRYGCELANLVTPGYDAERLEKTVSEYGADVAMVIEPDKAQILAACYDMGLKGHRQLGFYWAGMGGLFANQAGALLAGPTCIERPMSSTRGVATGDANGFAHDANGEPKYEIVSHSDVIAAFRAGEAKRHEELNNEKSAATRGVKWLAGPGKPAFPAAPLFLLFDACLDELGGGLDRLAYQRDIPLHTADWRDDIAVLVASSYFQQALDAAPGTSSSPFAIAMLNALAIPGLSIAQMSARIRSEVEALTDRFQTPRLFAGEEIQNHVFVAERRRGVIDHGCSPA